MGHTSTFSRHCHPLLTHENDHDRNQKADEAPAWSNISINSMQHFHQEETDEKQDEKVICLLYLPRIFIPFARVQALVAFTPPPAVIAAFTNCEQQVHICSKRCA
jgi:hypothetical protein